MRPSEDIAGKWFRAALRPGTGREVLAQIIADNTDCDDDYVEVWSDRYPAPLHIEPHGDSGCGLRIVASNGMNILCLGVSCGIVTTFLEHCIKLVNEDMKQREALGWMKHIGLPWKVVGHPGCWHLVTDAGGYVSASAASDGPMADALRYISDRMNNAGLDGWQDKKGGG